MSFSVAWAPAALSTFYRLPIHSATVIDRAVIHFAGTGLGEIQWVAPYHRLRAGVDDVALSIDREARQITVLYLHRAR